MIFPGWVIRRTMDPTFINRVINDPEVLPWVSSGQPVVDMSSAVLDPNNVCLISEFAAVIFHRIGPGRFEVHSQCLLEGRGAHAAQVATEVMRYIFTATDCVEVVTRVPDGNVGAIGIARHVGFIPTFKRPLAWTNPKGERVGVQFYSLTVGRWRERDPALIEIGASFHDWIEGLKDAPLTHPDDEDHDRAVGLASLMLRAGHGAKAAFHYNHWAMLAGYQPMTVLSERPLVVDVGEAILEVQNGEPVPLLVR